MSNIVPYSFDGANVRVIEISGETHFVGKDVADALGYANASDAMNDHCRGVAKRYPIPDALGRLQETRIISESDMLRLIVNSTLPAAARFERWVFEDVLPSIRKTGSYSAPDVKAANQTGLPEFRRARALELATKTAERIVAQFPSLSEDSRRVVFAKVINPVAGIEILSLPPIEKKRKTAGEVGELLGISANMVGRIANQHQLKTDEYGGYQLDKSAHSAKQVQAFVYNDAGVEAIKRHIDTERPGPQPVAKPVAASRVPEPQAALL